MCNWQPLQAIRQTGLAPDKVLHQPQGRRAERVVLLDALHLDRLRHTGAANTIATLEQSDLMSSTCQVVGRDQAINTSADDSDAL